MSFVHEIHKELSDFSPVKEEIMVRLYQNSTTTHITGFLIALLLAGALIKTSLPAPRVYFWLAIMGATYIGRFTLTYWYAKKKSPSLLWLNRYRLSSIITGFAWGASAILLFQPGDLTNQSIILFALTGICAGGAISYSSDYSVLIGFLLPVLFSMFIQLMIEGSRASVIMAIMIMLFLFFIVIHARRANKNFITNIELAKTALIREYREKAYRRIMEMIANSNPIDMIFNEIILSLEKQDLKMRGSILLLDTEGKSLNCASAPSFPAAYIKKIGNLKVGPNIGSCGAAAFTGKRRVTNDTLTDPNWVNFKQLAVEFNLRSCWSEPIKDSTGKVLGTFAIYYDVPTTPVEKDFQIIAQNASLAGIAIELARNSKEQRLASLFYQNTNESMMIADSRNIIVGVNPAFTVNTGYESHEVIGKSPDFLKSKHHKKSFYSEMQKKLNNTGKWQGEVWNSRKNGEVYAQWIRVNTIYDKNRNVINRVSLATDITEKKEAEDLIWKHANYDELTGLPNRRMFNDRFQQEIKKTKRAKLPLALLFIDLDEFKEVNDALGHAGGDLLLAETAARLTSCIRESDTVSQFNSLARLGGDEFTVILSELKDIDCVERITQTILEKISEPYQVNDEVVYISASIGITIFPDDALDIDTLLNNGDQAMYGKKIRQKSF